jgi:hypothetical protein
MAAMGSMESVQIQEEMRAGSETIDSGQ